MTSVRPPNAAILVVRETLEGVLSHDAAVRVMFDALRSARSVPETPEEVVDFVTGPLGELLAAEADEDTRDAVVERLVQLLGGGSEPPLELDISVEQADENNDDSVTRAMPTAFREPVSALVLSRSDRFAQWLQLSLGQSAPVTLRVVHDASSLRHDVFATFPLLVVIDATDPPEVELDVILPAVRGIPHHIVVIVWGAEHAFGRAIAERLDPGTRAVVLDEAEGMGPMLDLFHSRHQG